MTPTTMTFFERFEADILSGKKTITLRDESEKHYLPGSIVTVATYEGGREFCRLKIGSVQPILFKDLTHHHAEQENMTLNELKNVIQTIYPDIERLYLITYQLVIS